MSRANRFYGFLQSMRGPPHSPHPLMPPTNIRTPHYMKNLRSMMITFELLLVASVAAAEVSTDPTPSCSQYQNIYFGIISVDSFSGNWTYSIPTEPLKNKDKEVSWHDPVKGFLADPSTPKDLTKPAIKVTPENLTTEEPVEGLFVMIRIHYENASLGVLCVEFRENNTSESSAQWLNDTVVSNTTVSPTTPYTVDWLPIILSIVVAIVVFIGVIAACIYWKCIRGTSHGNEHRRDGDVELENVAAEPLNPNGNPICLCAQ
ncbi:uncharacterized protein [Hoplias malabaricus]|uniref:uncharacterized protein n=1 Tax=Hoplias malabaricus TaxID=27720 RepID=UPI0034625872